MAFKTFTAGSVLTATEVNDYLMKQAVIVCTSATRPSSPVEGMTIYETDTDQMQVYNGSAWVVIAGTAAWSTFTPTLTGATLSSSQCAYRITAAKSMNIRAFIVTTAGVTSFSFPLPGSASCPTSSLQVLAGAASGSFVSAQISAAGTVSVSCASSQTGWVLTGTIEIA